ncbi:MAG: GNAT family N-acetyltransferase [Gammaproteobacteria bacterium]|nr:MAG: GNAT family N-acetyltransferase [Gammaproteobacteria bacterium]
MSYGNTFVELDKSIHDRDSFDCGKDELNNFIRTFAARHMEAGVSRTMVLPASQPSADGKFPICAFFTIAPSAIERSTLPEAIKKKLPHYPVPVFLLAQLAVHNDYRGQSLGKVTLIRALKYFVDLLEHLPAYAVIVDCLDEEAESFYRKYGFEELCDFNGRKRMFLPMQTVLQLFK